MLSTAIDKVSSMCEQMGDISKEMGKEISKEILAKSSKGKK